MAADASIYFHPAVQSGRRKQGALIGIQDGQDLLSLQRDGQGRLLVARSPSGAELKFSYDDLDRITRVLAGNGEQREYEYDSNGRLSRAEAIGDKTEYQYEQHRLSILHNGSLLLRADYNENDRVTRVVLANGRVYSFAYTRNDRSSISSVAVRDTAGTSIRFDLIGPTRYIAQWIE